MTINERVKYLRKEYFGLSQKEFAEELGMKQTSVSTFEKNGATVTEPTIKAILLKYPMVNEEWIRTGKEPMILENSKISLDDYARSQGADDLDLKIIKLYLELKPEIRHAVVKHFMTGLSEKINFDEYSATFKTSEGSPKVLDCDSDTELPAASVQDKLVIQELMKNEPKEDNSAG